MSSNLVILSGTVQSQAALCKLSSGVAVHWVRTGKERKPEKKKVLPLSYVQQLLNF